MAHRIEDLIDDRPREGVFRVHRALFDDPDLFDFEIRHLFEGGWIFLGLDSQALRPHDFFTTMAGRVPVLVMRNDEGQLGAYINSCPHKGLRIAQTLQGNARLHVCPYHSWTFDSSGRNRGVKWQSSGCYSETWQKQSRDLTSLPAFSNFRGFLFGSLTGDVPPLEDYLGGAKRFIELVADQSEEGAELVPGAISYTFNANWKMQLENCSDAYHFTSTHPSYVELLQNRRTAGVSAVASVWDQDQSWHEDSTGIAGGSVSFDNGHVLNWGRLGIHQGHPLFERADALAIRLGRERRDWIFRMRNLTIFPNLQIAENASSQLRVIQPIAAGKTLMRTWCIAPKGEHSEARRQRIRQYEDFFNPSGMATPDDTVCYESGQRGLAAKNAPWLQGYGRGFAASQPGGGTLTDSIDAAATSHVIGDARLCDETLYQNYYRAWAKRIGPKLTDAAEGRS